MRISRFGVSLTALLVSGVTPVLAQEVALDAVSVEASPPVISGPVTPEVAKTTEAEGKLDIAVEAPGVEALAVEAPAVDVAVNVPAPEPVEPTIDYSAYDDFTARYVAEQRGRAKIAFKLIREHAPHEMLDYIEHLVAQDIANLPDDDLLAYMLNLQNAVVIQALIEQKRLKKDLKSLRGTAAEPGKLWVKPRVEFGGEVYSLSAIEAEILKRFKQEDVIYGLYQAIQGGPSLHAKAYTGATVHESLSENARRYINSKGIIHVNNDVVELTPIFMWYEESYFGGGRMVGKDGKANVGSKVLIQHLQKYAKPNLKSSLYRGARFETVEMNYGPDIYVMPKDQKQRKRRSKSKPPAQQQSRVPSGSYGS